MSWGERGREKSTFWCLQLGQWLTEQDSFQRDMEVCSVKQFPLPHHLQLKQIWRFWATGAFQPIFGSPWCLTWLNWGTMSSWGSLPWVLGLNNLVLCCLGGFPNSHKTLTRGDLQGLAAQWLSRATDPIHTQLPWEAASAWCKHQDLGSWASLDNYCSLEARWNLDWI